MASSSSSTTPLPPSPSSTEPTDTRKSTPTDTRESTPTDTRESTHTVTLPPRTVDLGPLTTTFVPPDGCTSQRGIALGNDNGQRDNPLLVYYGTIDRSSSCLLTSLRHSAIKSCFPPNFASYYNVAPTSGSGDVYPVYSPGLMCPSGYEPSCTFTKTTSSLPYIPDREAVDYTMQQLLKNSETAIGCCPSDYACHTSSYMLCISAVQPEPSFQSRHDYCSLINWSVGTALPTTAAIQSSSTYLISPQVLLIRGPTSSPSSYASDGYGNTGNDGLSTGAKVAIGVTIPIVVTLLAILSFFFIHRRRRRLQRTKGDEGDIASGSTGSPMSNETDLHEYDSKASAGGDKDSSRKGSPWVPAELDNGAVPELPGDYQFPNEIEGKSKPAELGERQPYLSYTNTPVDTDAEWETESDADSEMDADSVKSGERAKKGDIPVA